MKRRFILDPLMFTLSLTTSIAFLIICITMFPLNRFGSAVIFFMFFVIFLGFTISYGALIIVENEGVSKYTAGIMPQKMQWADIKEVGVCGTKIFNKYNLKNAGTLYIFFSKEEMNENKIFDMLLKWPPKGKLYLRYNEKRLTAVQMIWNGNIKTYNAGNLFIGEE